MKKISHKIFESLCFYLIKNVYHVSHAFFVQTACLEYVNNKVSYFWAYSSFQAYSYIFLSCLLLLKLYKILVSLDCKLIYENKWKFLSTTKKEYKKYEVMGRLNKFLISHHNSTVSRWLDRTLSEQSDRKQDNNLKKLISILNILIMLILWEVFNIS